MFNKICIHICTKQMLIVCTYPAAQFKNGATLNSKRFALIVKA